MAVDNLKVIDFIGVDNNTGELVLTISDHLEWDAQNQHVFALQEKINAYLAFLESGEVFDSYPQAKSKKCVISVVALHHPDETGRRFLEAAKEAVHGAGFEFRFEQKHFNSPS